jgi:uncharacterized protein YidB (DUF937 family)
MSLFDEIKAQVIKNVGAAVTRQLDQAIKGQLGGAETPPASRPPVREAETPPARESGGAGLWTPDAEAERPEAPPTRGAEPDPSQLIAMLLGYFVALIQKHGGIGGIVEEFRKRGLGAQVASWVGTGANQPLAPPDAEKIVSPQTIDFLASQFGVGRETMVQSICEVLPTVIDRLTPEGTTTSPSVYRF